MSSQSDFASTEESLRSLVMNEEFNELAQKNLSLKRMNRELKAVSYVLSHDLQEPLRKIRNFISLALHGNDELQDETRQYLEKTYSTAWHMQEMLDDLLMYFKVKDTKDKIERSDLRPILETVITDYEEMIRARNAKIDYRGLGEAEISPQQFRQLFHHLVSNSLKFAKSGRAPLISVKTEIVQGDSKVNKRLRRRRQYYHLIYSDNGTGFDPQYNARVFELFQRLNSKSEFEGSGIGLAICKRIVENHNGIIVADGQLNKGARFDIYIPMNRKDQKKKEVADQGSRFKKAKPPLR
jgi:light-regulated signal transduction histidine kinase (bacteriophytochrome)